MAVQKTMDAGRKGLAEAGETIPKRWPDPPHTTWLWHTRRQHHAPGLFGQAGNSLHGTGSPLIRQQRGLEPFALLREPQRSVLYITYLQP